MSNHLNKILHAVIAVAILAAPILAAPTPARATPAPCSVEEWQKPANFVDCGHRLRNDASRRANCVQAPTPDSPKAGVAGFFTTRPDEDLQSGVTGLYTRYGLSGYRVQTYDLTGGCASVATHPLAGQQDGFASGQFAVAAAVVGFANGLRDMAYNPGRMWAWSDGFVDEATRSIYLNVFTPFGVITLALIGLWLLWRARQGTMSQAVNAAGWALLVMVLATAVAKWPVTAAHGVDTAATTGLSTVHQHIGSAPQNVPANKCVLSVDACTDHRTPATRASDTLTEVVLYRMWLRAELGASDGPTADKFGRALYDAQTLDWDDEATIAANPAQRETIVTRKADQWNTIAAEIKRTDPQAYEHLQGLRGGDSAGAGFLAMVTAVAYTTFDIAASVVILLGFLILRLAIIFLPLLATFGMWLPAGGAVRRTLNAAVGSFISILLFGVVAALNLWIIQVVTSVPALPGWVPPTAVAIIGGTCLAMLRPIHKALRVFRVPGPEPTPRGAGLARLLRGLNSARQPAPPPTTTRPADVPTETVAVPRPESAARSAR